MSDENQIEALCIEFVKQDWVHDYLKKCPSFDIIELARKVYRAAVEAERAKTKEIAKRMWMIALRTKQMQGAAHEFEYWYEREGKGES